MKRFVAFLRGMNLGRRRITNDELCGHMADLGFQDVSAFLASGNVIFDAPRGSPKQVAARVEAGLREALDYEVPTFIRAAEQVRAIAARAPFEAAQGADGGKLQVALLGGAPPASAKKAALSLATEDDQLALDGAELYWLPRAGISTSELDMKALEAALGSMTVRTHRTLSRIVAKYFNG